MIKLNIKRHVSSLLATLLLFSVPILSGCQGEQEETAESEISLAESSAPTDETEADTAPEPINITIAGTDISEFVIIHDGSSCAAMCARRIRSAIYELTKCNLALKKDASKETEHEILVGKTNRKESADARSRYTRPNVFYDMAVNGTKLVLMGEGYKTLEHLADEFERLLESSGSENISFDGKILGGDILDRVDTNGISTVNRTDGTDLRVFHWNMAAPYLDPSVTPPPVVYSDNKTRGEVMADIILQLMPDIITTNEFYASHNGNTVFFDAVMGALGDYYVCLDSPYDKDKPEAGANAISGKTVNSNIIYRKDIGLEVISSSWRYSTEKTTVTSSNPGGYVYYHGSHTALFSHNGKKFILSTAHYADSRSSNKWAREHLDAIADMQSASAESSALPVILTGDLYTGYTSSSPESGYKYLVSQGYIDSQRTAKVNANENISHGTFHTIGERQTGRISEDFIWHTSEMYALCFKVLASADTDDTSDHYPVMADLRFK